jgi:hypothetical protein
MTRSDSEALLRSASLRCDALATLPLLKTLTKADKGRRPSRTVY